MMMLWLSCLLIGSITCRTLDKVYRSEGPPAAAPAVPNPPQPFFWGFGRVGSSNPGSSSSQPRPSSSDASQPSAAHVHSSAGPGNLRDEHYNPAFSGYEATYATSHSSGHGDSGLGGSHGGSASGYGGSHGGSASGYGGSHGGSASGYGGSHGSSASGYGGSAPGGSYGGSASGYGGSAPGGSYGGSASGYGGSAPGGSYGGSASGYGGSAPGGSYGGSASGYGGSAPGGSYGGGYGSAASGNAGVSYGYVAPHDESSSSGSAIGTGASTENPESVFSDVSDLEPVYSYSSRSSYQRGQDTFAQTRYIPEAPVPPFPLPSSKGVPHAPAKSPTKGGF